MPESLYGVAPVLVQRFESVFAAFVDSVKAAVAEAEQRPEFAESFSLRSWRAMALPLLEKGKSDIQTATAAFKQGDARPILVQAEDKRGLAKDLDGFPLTFAGPENAEKLESLVTAVVAVAYQVCAAAGIP